MNDENDRPEFVTTKAHVRSFGTARPIFASLLLEVRELSKKKPEATMSAGKVKIINRVLEDLLVFLKDQPDGKYLEALDTDALPQVSDALLIMVQFQAALASFEKRHTRWDSDRRDKYWLTEEFLAAEEIDDDDFDFAED